MDADSEQTDPSRRRPKRAAAMRNYNDSLLDDLIHDHIGPGTKKRNKTMQEREKETEIEAMLALSLGFPIDALIEDEFRAGVVDELGGEEQNNYIVVRNHILARWRRNVRSWLTRSHIRETVSGEYDHLMCKAYDFLLERGYINFGVSPAVRARIPEEQTCGSVVIVGAGLAGLAAAGQLLGFGFKVIVLEARDRPGGRVYTQKMGEKGRFAAVDLGGSVITGIHANPLGVLARQLSIPLHKIRDACPLYRPDGSPVDEKLDSEVELVFNNLLKQATELRGIMGEHAYDISLGSAIEKLRRLYGVLGGNDEMELLNWHLANLEYANAGCLSELSLTHWDQDDPFEMDGDHCFLAGGNWRLIEAMSEHVPILYRRKVTSIKYGDGGVEVAAGDQVFRADMVLCTVPLGVLKKGDIEFNPELPPVKIDSIRRLGFGLLNKVAMVFPFSFWGEDLDTFGCLNKDRCKRGEFFLFYSYHTVSGGPVLIALVAGKAALEFERTDPAVMLHSVLNVLRGIFSPKGVNVPDPIQTVCTRWGNDPLSYGSYSHIQVGSSGKDYDILAQNVNGRLFFAGEATCRQYPATMHGAFLSGLREASCILNASRDREVNANSEVKKCSQKNYRICCDILLDLFEKPDLSCGQFLFAFNASTSEDPKALGLMKYTLATSQDKSQNSLNLWLDARESRQLSDLYTILSREQAEELRKMSGDERKMLYLICTRFSLQLMGISSLCDIGSSLILSIANSRKTRGRNRSSIVLQQST